MAFYNYSAVHILGILITAADALSRRVIYDFFSSSSYPGTSYAQGSSHRAETRLDIRQLAQAVFTLRDSLPNTA